MESRRCAERPCKPSRGRDTSPGVIGRRLAAALFIYVAVVAWGPAALARSYSIPSADVVVQINEDGSVSVTEAITFNYDGTFQGANRDIPSRFGEKVVPGSVHVGEEGFEYSPGGELALEPGPSNTFVAGPYESGTRIVWRYQATNETRRFIISYRMINIVSVHSDTAEINMRVWGDHWPAGVDRVHAEMKLPKPASPDQMRIWGNSLSTQGTASIGEDGSGATLETGYVAEHSWVEMRMLFPISVLDSQTGTRSATKNFKSIVLAEQAEDAKVQARLDRFAWFRRNLWWLIPSGLFLAFGPAAMFFGFLARHYGTDDQILPLPPHYVREPPDNEPPALVVSLVSEGQKAGIDAFLATFFDLLRRGYFSAYRELSEHKTWMGLKSETISDLRVKLAKKSPDDLLGFERETYDTIEWIIPPDGELLSEFSDILRQRSEKFYWRFTEFQADVSRQLESRHLIDRTGKRMHAVGLVAFVLLIVTGFVVGIFETRWFGYPLGGIAIGGLGFTNAFALGVAGAAAPRLLTKRSPEGARLAAGFAGLRRYLEDFSAMKEAPPISIVLWERLLVYAIAFGIAGQVLKAAQLFAPEDLEKSSQLFWVDNFGGLGNGLTAWNLSSLTSGIGRAVSAGAPSSSSGFGGGFSGGGSGGGGSGGGGGAW